MSEFHNPYNFIPALPPKKDEELGQQSPVGHDRYHNDKWSGRITIRITAKTPIIIPDTTKMETGEDYKKHNPDTKIEMTDDHKIFEVRKDASGKPLLPVTSLKGILRSSYEAITNSRLSVFKDHETPPARRMAVGNGAAMVPTRVIENENNKLSLELLLGNNSNPPEINPTNKKWRVPGRQLHAAWLPLYSNNLRKNIRYEGTDQIPEHGDHVICILQKVEHKVWNRDRQCHIRNFDFWQVVSIAPYDQADTLNMDTRATSINADERRRSSVYRPYNGEIIEAYGYVYISNNNIEKKHDERVFFYSDNEDECKLKCELSGTNSKKINKDWQNLIKNYHEIHKGDPEITNGIHLSRHVKDEKENKLSVGTLCYALLKTGQNGKPVKQNNQYVIEALYPVMISRELGYVSPEQLLDDELRPATKIEQLSAADRVFGWVKQNGDGAYKGQVNIHPVTFNSDTSIKKINGLAIKTFGKPLPLANLSTPKISQARFYVAKNSYGQPLDQTDIREMGYFRKTAKGPERLRGRKTYIHHKHTLNDDGDACQDYWNPEEGPLDPIQRNDKTYYREYIRHDKERDSQNRSYKDWVQPGTTFSTDIDVSNLNKSELGALLWLLNLDQGYLRIGSGGPLGFGSIKIEITKLNLINGEGKKQEYSSLLLLPLRNDQ